MANHLSLLQVASHKKPRLEDSLGRRMEAGPGQEVEGAGDSHGRQIFIVLQSHCILSWLPRAVCSPITTFAPQSNFSSPVLTAAPQTLAWSCPPPPPPRTPSLPAPHHWTGLSRAGSSSRQHPDSGLSTAYTCTLHTRWPQNRMLVYTNIQFTQIHSVQKYTVYTITQCT